MDDTVSRDNKFIIPKVSWKYFDELILKIGNVELSKIENFNVETNFLEAIDFVAVAKEEHTASRLGFDFTKGFEIGTIEVKEEKITISLTSRGKEYYIQKFIKNNIIEAKRVLCEALKLHPAVILISQILNGSKNITRMNIYNLLRHHSFNLDFIKEVELNSFLEILKIGDIVSYNKNTRDVKVLWQQEAETLSAHQFISPDTPFSNIKRLKDIIKSLKGTVYWIDKHFDKKAFDILVESVDASKISNFIIISSEANKTQSAANEFLKLKAEFHYRGINIEWKIISDQNILSSFHDRWLCDSKDAWNIPPVNSIFKGQESEMLMTSNKPNINKLLTHVMTIV